MQPADQGLGMKNGLVTVSDLDLKQRKTCRVLSAAGIFTAAALAAGLVFKAIGTIVSAHFAFPI